MIAIIPLLAGLLLGRFTRRSVAIPVVAAIWALAVAVLAATAPEHGAEATAAIPLGAALAVLTAAITFAGIVWRSRALRAAAVSVP